MEQPKYNATSFHTKIRAVFLAMRRPDTPLYAKLAGGLFVYYALSPLDLIPDFIPLLGRADDMIILPFLAWLSFKLVPDEIMQECMREAENMPVGSFSRKMRYAIPVICVWMVILMRCAKAFYNILI